MKEIFVVIRAAVQKDGESVFVTTEGAFTDVNLAKAFLTGKPTIWDEVIDSMECSCERAVHSVILS